MPTLEEIELHFDEIRSVKKTTFFSKTIFPNLILVKDGEGNILISDYNRTLFSLGAEIEGGTLLTFQAKSFGMSVLYSLELNLN